ncbi:MAG: hypothetical protein ACYTFW_00150 [Planctomycetota bacterium]|jgi:hypothetical protein
MDAQHVTAIAQAFQVPEEYLRGAIINTQLPSYIIPMTTQDELVMLREQKRSVYFRIGDIANELILIHKGTLSANKVYRAMSSYCDTAPRTIRYYAETANFYPIDIREEYDMLPFSHFDLARNFGDHWEEVLQLGAQNPYWSRNRLEKAANKWLEIEVMKKMRQDSAMCDPVRGGNGEDFENVRFGLPSEIEITLNLEGGYSVDPRNFKLAPPTRPKMSSAQLVGQIAELSDKIIQLLQNYGDRLPQDLKDRLVSHLTGINGELPAITFALDDDGAK